MNENRIINYSHEDLCKLVEEIKSKTDFSLEFFTIVKLKPGSKKKFRSGRPVIRFYGVIISHKKTVFDGFLFEAKLPRSKLLTFDECMNLLTIKYNKYLAKDWENGELKSVIARKRHNNTSICKRV